MARICKALVLSCIDFRFHKDIRQFLVDRGLDGDYDLVCMAGSARNLVQPHRDAAREIMLHQIDIASSLHEISEVYLINHTDCGAYQDIAESPHHEEELHRNHLHEAHGTLQERFPAMKVHKFIARHNHGNAVGFDEIN